MKKVAILQSNYIPWKGYFDLIAAVDEFIIYDEVQFTKNDWRNRNMIKTPKGREWLSIPVGSHISRPIHEVLLNDSKWQIRHWKTLVTNYARSRHYSEIATLLEPVYQSNVYTHLSSLNRDLIILVCSYLGIATTISDSREFAVSGDRTERLVRLVQLAGGTEYISGPAAKAYLDATAFEAAGIGLTWFNYDGYPTYPQLWGNFVHGVSVLDLLFNCGTTSPRYMRHVYANARYSNDTGAIHV